MSKIEVNTVEPQCGTTLTLGGSGDTVQLGSGASQTGFGREGSVDWVTDSIKTATFTAVSGKGYFCNTTGGSFELDLPAGSAGAIVALQDYNNTFDSYSLTVDPNGSEKINGGAAGEVVTLSTEGLGITFVYIDSTVGWRSVDSNEYSTAGVTPTFIVASGGNSCGTTGDYKWHAFTGPGTFTVSCVGNPAGSDTVDYMVVAGGGGGGGTGNSGYASGGGGGAGGWRASSGTASGSYTAGPAPLTAPVAALSVTATGYPITVGGGGSAGPTTGTGGAGNTSTFSTVSSSGGGGGGNRNAHGVSGGSGGGAGACASLNGGTGNTPTTTPAQGTDGGDGLGGPGGYGGGGGGGATVAGTGATAPKGGLGGDGATSNINNTPTAYGGGGGGGAYNNPAGAGTGGAGGGGPGGAPPAVGVAGTCNTGGGGGGGSTQGPDGTQRTGGAGGSGIVIIRYKYQ